MQHGVLDEPSDISVEDGHVVIRCVDGMTITITADAAVITSDRLLRAGLEAKKQQAGHHGAER
ncbi:MAG TPA: hypothetical protein VJ859_08790 [Allosphingosinicella sp.]|nr:hypothetical protein [Allosphingosinicella sp.]